MLNFIDSILNKITMYRLVLYYVLFLVGAAVGLAYLGFLPYSPIAIVVSAIFIALLCVGTNELFARTFKVPANVESVYITALILVLIITPPTSWQDGTYFWLALWASVWAIASKYIFAIRKKHVFNPAALGVAITSLAVGLSATWWVGTLSMVPFVLVGGILLVRKLQRFDLVWSFLVIATIATVAPHAVHIENLFTTTWRVGVYTPLFFFAFVMLTEPLTSPPTKMLRIWYGALIGFLFSPAVHIGSIYSTPELALLAGNIFSYLVSPKKKTCVDTPGHHEGSGWHI